MTLKGQRSRSPYIYTHLYLQNLYIESPQIFIAYYPPFCLWKQKESTYTRYCKECNGPGAIRVLSSNNNVVITLSFQVEVLLIITFNKSTQSSGEVHEVKVEPGRHFGLEFSSFSLPQASSTTVLNICLSLFFLSLSKCFIAITLYCIGSQQLQHLGDNENKKIFLLLFLLLNYLS